MNFLLLAAQIMQGQIDPGPRDGHAGREAGRDGLIHGMMCGVDARDATDQRRREVVAKRHGGRLERLVAPLGDRHALPPADLPSVARDFDDDRRATA